MEQESRLRRLLLSVKIKAIEQFVIIGMLECPRLKGLY